MEKKPCIALNSRLFLHKGSGIPNYIQHLSHTLLKQGWHMLFFQTNTQPTLGETKVIAGPKSGWFGMVFDTLLVLFLIYKHRPALYIGPSFILPLWKPRWCNYILTVHDLSIRTHPRLYKPIFRWIYTFFLRISLQRADAIVAVSHSTKTDLLHFYTLDPQKITVSYPGIHPHFLTPHDSDRLVSEPYILSVTTHGKRKNIPAVLQALALLKQRGVYMRYIIVGIIGDQQTQTLLSCATSYGVTEQITLWGYATETELIALYRHAALFVYPSFYEGFGFPLIEAMVSKTLVITSNTSSMKELVTDPRFLVDPANIDALAEKISACIALPETERKQVIEKNYQFALSCTREKSAQDYGNIFHDLLKKKH